MSISDIIPMLPAVFLAGGIYALVRLIAVKLGKLVCSPKREILQGIFVCYLTALVCITLTPDPFWEDLWSGQGFADTAALMFGGEYKNNMMIYYALSGNSLASKWQIYMLIANIALFIPMGVLLPMVFKKLKWWQADLIGFGASTIIELIQPIFGRTADLDDIITNTLGTIIGCGIFKVIQVIINKARNKARKRKT